jgi:hypothetical protein
MVSWQCGFDKWLDHHIAYDGHLNTGGMLYLDDIKVRRPAAHTTQHTCIARAGSHEASPQSIDTNGFLVCSSCTYLPRTPPVLVASSSPILTRPLLVLACPRVRVSSSHQSAADAAGVLYHIWRLDPGSQNLWIVDPTGWSLQLDGVFKTVPKGIPKYDKTLCSQGTCPSNDWAREQ